MESQNYLHRPIYMVVMAKSETPGPLYGFYPDWVGWGPAPSWKRQMVSIYMGGTSPHTNTRNAASMPPTHNHTSTSLILYSTANEPRDIDEFVPHVYHASRTSHPCDQLCRTSCAPSCCHHKGIKKCASTQPTHYVN